MNIHHSRKLSRAIRRAEWQPIGLTFDARLPLDSWSISSYKTVLLLARISHEEYILVLKTKKKLAKIRRLY